MTFKTSYIELRRFFISLKKSNQHNLIRCTLPFHARILNWNSRLVELISSNLSNKMTSDSPRNSDIMRHRCHSIRFFIENMVAMKHWHDCHFHYEVLCAAIMSVTHETVEMINHKKKFRICHWKANIVWNSRSTCVCPSRDDKLIKCHIKWTNVSQYNPFPPFRST